MARFALLVSLTLSILVGSEAVVQSMTGIVSDATLRTESSCSIPANVTVVSC